MRRLLIGLLALSCHDGSGSTGVTTDAGTDAGLLPDLGGGSCSVELADPPDEGAAHTAQCGPVTYGSKPPSSGTHYPVWPVFRVYDKPVPWGYLVHGLEHGAIVIVYNCPDGCPDQVQSAKDLVAATPPKPGCSRAPVIMAPDPTLDVPFAASSWGHTLRAKCFDRDRFAEFIQLHANKGRENIPTDCGSLDAEAAGWCP
jgi:hypothetical protein